MLVQILHAAPERDDSGASGVCRAHAAVKLERAQRDHQHDRMWPETSRAAFDVEKLFGAEIEPEAGLGEHDLSPPKQEARGNDAVASVSDVAERAAMDKGRGSFDCLYKIRQHGIAQKRRHRAFSLEICGSYKGPPGAQTG